MLGIAMGKGLRKMFPGAKSYSNSPYIILPGGVIVVQGRVHHPSSPVESEKLIHLFIHSYHVMPPPLSSKPLPEEVACVLGGTVMFAFPRAP